MGKYDKKQEPGLYITCPCINSIAYAVDERELVLDVPPSEA